MLRIRRGVNGYGLLVSLVLVACRANGPQLGDTPAYEGTITGFSFESGAATPGELVRFTVKAPVNNAIPPEGFIRVDSITQFKIGPGASVDWTTQGLPDLRSAYVRVWFHSDRHISVTKTELFGTARIVAVDSTPLSRRTHNAPSSGGLTN
jgi:hypothetical protein